MVEDESSERAKEQAKKNFEGLSMDNAETMKEYIACTKPLALNVQYHDIEVSEQEISHRTLNGLPSSYAPEKRNFALKTDFTLAELEGGLVRVEELGRDRRQPCPGRWLQSQKRRVERGAWKPQWRRTRQARR